MPRREWTPQRLKALRLRLGETQDQFARRVGTIQVRIADFEASRLPIRPTLQRLLYLIDTETRR